MQSKFNDRPTDRTGIKTAPRNPADLEVIDLDDDQVVWVGSVDDFIEANKDDHDTCSAVLDLERYADGTFITWTGYAVREVRR